MFDQILKLFLFLTLAEVQRVGSIYLYLISSGS
jgi:hypothetical protein